MSEVEIEKFFATARMRYDIYLRRKAGLPKPWTDDPIFRQNKFCNVFRENDKTTEWFSKHVRTPMRNSRTVLLATVLFRMLNRISVGEVIFTSPDLWKETLFDRYIRSENISIIEHGVREAFPKGPWVTGAYYMASPTGKGWDKLKGMLSVVDDFTKRPFSIMGVEVPDWKGLAGFCRTEKEGEVPLKELWQTLGTVPYLGRFHSYEIVSDLRHTCILDNAPDIETWANAGPGAQRGLSRIFSRPLNKTVPAVQASREMQYLLLQSRFPEYWPETYPRMEMREIEHWLCEFDKYSRVKEGSGKIRGSFNG